MFGLFSKSCNKSELKGYRVTNKDRSKKYGIAASSLEMLKVKASAKFNIPNGKLYLAKDGTEIQDEDYFATLEAQTVIVIASEGDVVKTDFELLYEDIRQETHVIRTGHAIKEFLSINKKLLIKFIKECEQNKTESCNLSSLKRDHEEWFKGVPEYLKTKEQVMTRKSQDRIRSYYYKTKDELIKSELYKTNKKARELIDTTLEIFKNLLITVEYFGSYFDRLCSNKHESVKSTDDTDSETPRKKIKESLKLIIDEQNLSKNLCVSLCSREGEFICQGLWDCKQCKYENHKINPYESREKSILFQIWNFDHCVEISRSILPSLLDSVKEVADGKAICQQHQRKCENISVLEYFFEIFTVKNLKFVHIVCHDKNAHTNKSNGSGICDQCDEYEFIQKILKAYQGI